MNTATVKELPFNWYNATAARCCPPDMCLCSVKKLHNAITICLWLIFPIPSPCHPSSTPATPHYCLLAEPTGPENPPLTYLLQTPIHRPKPLTTLGSFQRELILCVYLHYLGKQPKLHRNKGVLSVISESE